jgi:hypothetical protein
VSGALIIDPQFTSLNGGNAIGEVSIEDLPPLLIPRKGRYGLIDL